MKDLHIKIEDQQHHAFGLKCFEKETKMSAVVRKLIEMFLNGEIIV